MATREAPSRAIAASLVLFGAVLCGSVTMTVVEADDASALTVVTVTSNANSGAGTLREALTNASSGGSNGADDAEVRIPASVGEIDLTSPLTYDGGDGFGHSLAIVGSGNTIEQTTAATNLLFVTGGASSNSYSGLDLVGNGGAGIADLSTGPVDITDVSASGFVVALAHTNGNGTFTRVELTGNQIGLSASNPQVVDSTITGNQDGIQALGTATVESSTVSDNSSEGVNAPSVVATDSHLDRNASAGILFGASATVTRTTINGGPGRGITWGGGGAGDVELIDSQIIGHTITAFGANGGAVETAGSITATRSTIADNHVTGRGGGLFTFTGPIEVTESTVSGNTADQGGGVEAFDGSVVVTNSTITDNTAAGEGGGVFANVDVTTVYSTIVGNGGGPTANVFAGGGFSSFGSIVAQPRGAGAVNCAVGSPPTTSDGWNYSDDTSCGFTNVANSDREDVTAPELGALAANGGPTLTVLPAAASPLVDAIPNGSCDADLATGITTDQRGFPRPGSASESCDVGAVEVQPPPPTQLVPRFTG